jgi:hypothetical protein
MQSKLFNTSKFLIYKENIFYYCLLKEFNVLLHISLYQKTIINKVIKKSRKTYSTYKLIGIKTIKIINKIEEI